LVDGRHDAVGADMMSVTRNQCRQCTQRGIVVRNSTVIPNTTARNRTLSRFLVR